MNEFECINKIKSVHARAMQEINSYIKDYAFSKFGIREGDIIYYQHYNAFRPTYLFIEKIISNVESVISRGANIIIYFEGFQVDENGFKMRYGAHSKVVFCDEFYGSKLISVTNLIYKGER